MIMLCDVCHKREATIHNTKIVGDSLSTTNLCTECLASADPGLAQSLTSASETGCHYCGGEPDCSCPDLTAASVGAQKSCWLCSHCAQEFYDYADRKLPGLASGKFAPEQVAQVTTILAKLDQHMRQWVLERSS